MTLWVEPPTDPQLGMIARLCAERGWQPPEAVHSKTEASEIITAMTTATYRPERFTAARGLVYGDTVTF